MSSKWKANEIGINFNKKLMRAKVINLPRQNKNESFTIEKCRKILGANEVEYTDEQIILMRDYLFILARIYFDYYQRTYKEQLKVIHLNKIYNGTEDSDNLCSGEYRRAS